MKNDSIEYIKRYDLGFLRFEEINLENTCAQYRPCEEFNNLFTDENGDLDFTMKNSPHFDLASLYYNQGLKWLNNNFKHTRYYRLKKYVLGKGGHLPKRKINLFESLKKGYLSGDFSEKYIVLLERPLAETRYKIDCSNHLYPEVFMGHHRIGALLGLKIKTAKVIIAKDLKPCSKNCYGKLHNIYKSV